MILDIRFLILIFNIVIDIVIAIDIVIEIEIDIVIAITIFYLFFVNSKNWSSKLDFRLIK